MGCGRAGVVDDGGVRCFARGRGRCAAADGSVPDPVFIPMTSAGGGREVSQWSIYVGGDGVVRTPRAAALRAVCSCGWTGPPHSLQWEEFGEQDLVQAAGDVADTCAQEWDVHTLEVDRSAITVPEPLADLLGRVESEIEKLARTTPLAGPAGRTPTGGDRRADGVLAGPGHPPQRHR